MQSASDAVFVIQLCKQQRGYEAGRMMGSMRLVSVDHSGWQS